MSKSGDPRPLQDNLDLARKHLRSAPEDRPPAPEITDEVVDFEAVRRERRRAAWHQAIPSRFLNAAPANLEAEVLAEIQPWLTITGARPNLIINGPVGSGKSTAAVAVCREDFGRGMDVAFAPAADLIEGLKPNGPHGLYDDLAHIERLILDDVGAERSTDFAASELSRLINRRWLEELPTVATTMLDMAQLRTHLGEHTFSRLVGSEALIVTLSGTDRRRGD